MSFIYRDRKDDEFDYGSTFCNYSSICKTHNCGNCPRIVPDVHFSDEQKAYIRARVEYAIYIAKCCTDFYGETMFGCHYNDYLRGNLESILADFVGMSVYELFCKGKKHG